jgi:hypothetical protein
MLVFRDEERSMGTAAARGGSSVDFRSQVDLCYEELVPRLKLLAREIDARTIIFGLMCHLGWGLQAAQLLGRCTAGQALFLLKRSGRKPAGRPARRVSLVRRGRVDLTQLGERAAADQQPFDADAAEAFTKITRWLSPMSKATSDWVVLTCVADVLVHFLDGQDPHVIEFVWEWIRELALESPHSG